MTSSSSRTIPSTTSSRRRSATARSSTSCGADLRVYDIATGQGRAHPHSPALRLRPDAREVGHRSDGAAHLGAPLAHGRPAGARRARPGVRRGHGRRRRTAGAGNARPGRALPHRALHARRQVAAHALRQERRGGILERADERRRREAAHHRRDRAAVGRRSVARRQVPRPHRQERAAVDARPRHGTRDARRRRQRGQILEICVVARQQMDRRTPRRPTTSSTRSGCTASRAASARE